MTLFYIGPEDGIMLCAAWHQYLNSRFKCPVDLPEIKVAPGSRQISATWLSPKSDNGSLFLIFQEPSQGLVILQGFRIDRPIEWVWHSETDRFNSALVEHFALQSFEDDYKNPHLVTSCIAAQITVPALTEGPFYLGCLFVRDGTSSNTNVSDVTFLFDIENTTRDITISRLSPLTFDMDYSLSHIVSLSTILGPSTPVIPNSESALMIGNPGSTMIWFESPVPLGPSGGELPSPEAPFPFQRLSSTFAWNTTKTYLYHQITDSTIGEEYSDGDSRVFWISKNVTIDIA